MLKHFITSLAAFSLLASPVAAEISVNGQVVPTTNVDVLPNYYNNNPALLPKWHLALARAATGGARAKLGVLGDSTSEGAGAGGGTYGMNDSRRKTWSSYLKVLLQAATGVPVTDEVALGDHGAPDTGTAGITAHDPRLTVAGTSWSRTVDSLGGQMFNSTTGSDAITFAPTTAVDTCDIWYVQQPSQGTFTITDASGTLATVNAANATGNWVKVTVTRTAGTGAISLQRTVAGTLYISGFDCYNSTAPGVTIANMSHYGTTAANKAVTTSPWSPANAMALYGADLWLINLGINDRRLGQTDAQYLASLQAIVTKAKTTSDVIIVWHHPDDPSSTNFSSEPAFRAAALQVARANGLIFVDLGERFVSRSNSLSLYYDSIHLVAAGYWDIAVALLKVVLQ